MATDDIRNRINNHLAATGRGAAAELARSAGITPGTLSKFRAGTYRGRNELVAERLAGILASQETAEAIAGGEYRIAWLVQRNRRLQLVTRPETLESIRAAEPDIQVTKIWYGPRPGQIKIVE